MNSQNKVFYGTRNALLVIIGGFVLLMAGIFIYTYLTTPQSNPRMLKEQLTDDSGSNFGSEGQQQKEMYDDYLDDKYDSLADQAKDDIDEWEHDEKYNAAINAETGNSSSSNTSSGEILATKAKGAASWICSRNAYNCSDFSSRSEMLSCFNTCMDERGFDVHWLDGDHDGIPCE